MRDVHITCSNGPLVVLGVTVVALFTVFAPVPSSAGVTTGACCHGSLCNDGVSLDDCSNLFMGSFGGGGSACSDPGVCFNCGDSVVQLSEECDDGALVAGDGCDHVCMVETCWACDNGPGPQFGPSVCVTDDNEFCDDDDVCTLDDQCSGGVCVGAPTIVPAACPWALVGGDSFRPVQAVVRGSADVNGDTCAQTASSGTSALLYGDVVVTASSGDGAKFSPKASVVGDIVTGGADISGRPGGTLLPGLLTDLVPGGTSTVQAEDPTRDLDATGNSALGVARVGECQDAIDSINPSASLLDSLGETDPRGEAYVPIDGNLDIDATNAVNVVVFDGLDVGKDATITLDGNSIPDVVFVLRVHDRFKLGLGSSFLLTGGAAPERVIVYGLGRCKVGPLVAGAGTLFCPNGRVKLGNGGSWNGSVIGGERRVDLGSRVELNHVPLLVALP